jgi:signal transduction histidine kinase
MMYCAEIIPTTYWLFSSEVPTLVYYSHIPSLFIALALAGLLLSQKHKTLPSVLLILLNLLFSGIILNNLVLWTSSDLGLITFLWELSQIIFTAIPLVALFLFYAFSSKKRIPLLYKALWSLPLIAVAAFSFSSNSVIYADATTCVALISSVVDYMQAATTAVVIMWLLLAGIRRISTIADHSERRKVLLFTIGIGSFLGVFALTWTVASLFGFFALEQYGLYGMVAFMTLLTYLIVHYRAFNVGLIASQALVIALIILIGSQFTFVRNTTNLILTAIALVLTGVIGIILIRSVKREIEQRKHIELLAKDLESSNKQQIILIHFITHQIKGFVAKSRNIFATLLDGDYGQVQDTMRPMLEEGLRSDTKGVSTIQEILNAANIKSGKVSYVKQEFDVKALVDEVGTDLRAAAEAKGLQLTTDTGTEPLMFAGDRAQLVNAFKNLVDNSIKYTPKGEVRVSLAKDAGKLRFMVQDTGVGISKEDMAHLFTEGGHGKDSVSINVESTGFGLYIVKNIIEAHNGKVWAESEGAGKGSRFITELPV